MKPKSIFLVIIFCSLIIGCASKQWEEVDSIRSIKKGDVVRIEPLKDSTIVISAISKNPATDFEFKCTLLKMVPNLKFKGASAILSSLPNDRSSFETQAAGSFETWPGIDKEKNIKISYMYLPLMGAYKGNGKIYLYVIDSTEKCISNIVEWKVKFD